MIWIITALPRLVIRAFKVSHKHKYVYFGTFDGGLAGSVGEWKCLWCGEKEIWF
ncbi:MAG: hypothetical protein J6S14_19420 [Clostridia bacterium]|nr:hypothetical protein [Clostridia bacterium]